MTDVLSAARAVPAAPDNVLDRHPEGPVAARYVSARLAPEPPGMQGMVFVTE